MSAYWFWARVVLTAAGAVLSASPVVLAQTSASDQSRLSRRVSSGDVVFVTTRSDGEIRGRLVRLSSDAIVIVDDSGERTIAFNEAGWIEKRGDRLWNGAVIGGALLGASMAAGAGASCSPDCDTQVPATLAFGVAVGATIGALIDWAVPGRTLLYGRRRGGSHSVPGPAGIESPEYGDSFETLWSRVSPGNRIGLRTTSGTTVEGRFVRASPSSISVTTRHELREISARDVTEVRRYRGGTHVKKGLLIGMPLGGLYGSRACYSGLDEPYPTHDSGVPCAAGVLLGAVTGGAVGALIGGSTFGSTVVYGVVPDTSLQGMAFVASFTF